MLFHTNPTSFPTFSSSKEIAIFFKFFFFLINFLNYNYFKILHFSSGLRKIIFMILIAHREPFIPNVLIYLTQIAYSFLFLKFGCHLVVISNASIYTIVPVAKPLPLIGIQLYLIFTFLIFLWLFIQNKFLTI